MRFLANENFPRLTVEALRNAGYDTLWIKTDAPGIADEQVMAMACRQQRVLLTFDKDFGELVFHHGQNASYGIILFRIPMPSAVWVTQTVLETIQSRNDWQGHFSVVNTDDIRIRPLPVVGLH
ncbi:MAG: hypothetical protein GY862_32270 [Gammaproteobacteria bacterium]|nr:hypothetical protein [Gammaproteobacteria bacterium]